MLILGNTTIVPLSQGKVAMVDAVDAHLVRGRKSFAICIKGHWYAATGGGQNRAWRMHWSIMGAKGVDHIDGDGLNNRRSNLRVCTQSQNAKNRSKCKTGASSPYKGVWWDKRHGKWTSVVMTDYKRTYLGYFDDPVDAAKAYDAVARNQHGEYAKVNFVE